MYSFVDSPFFVFTRPDQFTGSRKKIYETSIK